MSAPASSGSRSSMMLLLFVVLLTLGFVGPTTSATAQGFIESFDAPVLAPEWTLAGYTGAFPRSYGYTSPANEYSLTARPGHLRYIVQPMTHWDGFLNDYQTTYSYHSCCNHDAGLELQRSFTGDHWTLETRVLFHLPFANGRFLGLRVYFGDGGPNTFYVSLARLRDVHPYNALNFALIEKYGSTLPERTVIEEIDPSLDPITTDDSTHLFRIKRAGSVLTVTWSDDDGVTWQTAFTHDLGNQLDGLAQRVVITGLSWFVTAGSYADVDYVKVTPESNVLDDFNRANGGIGTKWSGFKSGYRIYNQTLRAWTGGPIYWRDGSEFGTSQEAFVTFTAVSLGEGNHNGLVLKVQGNTAPDWAKGCIDVFYDELAHAVTVSTYRPGEDDFALYPSEPVTFTDGDVFRARVLADGRVLVYRNSTLISTVTLDAADQAFFNGRVGRVGMWFEQAALAQVDDFGGGNLAP